MLEKTELTEPAEVIVISTDVELRKAMESSALSFQYGLERVYLAWVALGLGERELSKLVNIKDPKRLIQEVIYSANENTYKALGLQKEAVLAMIELPPNWKKFDDAARGFTTYAPNIPALSHFEIQKGEVIAKPSLQVWIDGKTQSTITHPKQIRAYRAAEKLAAQIKDFEDEYGLTVIPKPGDAGIFSRGVLIPATRYGERETVDYSDILLNKLKFKTIKTDE